MKYIWPSVEVLECHWTHNGYRVVKIRRDRFLRSTVEETRTNNGNSEFFWIDTNGNDLGVLLESQIDKAFTSQEALGLVKDERA